MKGKIAIVIVLILVSTLFFSGCDTVQTRIVVKGTITKMEHHQRGMLQDSIYIVTFGNGTNYSIRSSDVTNYKLFVGSNVILELHTLLGGSDYYSIYKCEIM